MTDASLRGDCANCAALCCIVYPFDRSPAFAYDKPADEPCRHLDGGHRCTIHDRLDASGFAGCVAYDCFGAGQIVTSEVFGGRSWRDDPALLRPMAETFAILRRARELLAALKLARTLPLPPEDASRCEAYEITLAGDSTPWTHASVTSLAANGRLDEIARFVRAAGRAGRPAN